MYCAQLYMCNYCLRISSEIVSDIAQTMLPNTSAPANSLVHEVATNQATLRAPESVATCIRLLLTRLL